MRRFLQTTKTSSNIHRFFILIRSTPCDLRDANLFRHALPCRFSAFLFVSSYMARRFHFTMHLPLRPKIQIYFWTHRVKCVESSRVPICVHARVSGIVQKLQPIYYVLLCSALSVSAAYGSMSFQLVFISITKTERTGF